MSYTRAAILALAALPMAFGNAGDSFEKGARALASKDYAAAFDNMEAALKEEPDNLRYASEYRMAVIAASSMDMNLRMPPISKSSEKIMPLYPMRWRSTVEIQ